MASTGAVLFFKPNFSAQSAGTTGAVLFVPLRLATGRYTSSTISASANRRGRKVAKPSASVPIVQANGLISPVWDAWFNYYEQTFLGSLSGPTLPDVSQFVTVSQVNAIASSAAQSLLEQQVRTNAQSLSAVVQVAQTAALPGATQIPMPQIEYTAPPSPPADERGGAGGGGGGGGGGD